MIKSGTTFWNASKVNNKCDFCDKKAEHLLYAKLFFSSEIRFICKDHHLQWINNRLNI